MRSLSVLSLWPKGGVTIVAKKRPWWKRIVDSLFGKDEPEAPTPAAASPPSPPKPPKPPSPPSFDDGFDWSWVPPEESGIPPDDEEGTLYEQLVSDFAITDSFAQDLLWQGWFEEGKSTDQRKWARETFFIYTGISSYEFDWDAWRDWYQNSAA